MSVAENINRIIGAKDSLKTSIEKRGVSIENNGTIDTFSQALESCPYSVRGYYTPGEDTNEFSIQNLPFKPRAINISNLELYTTIIPRAVIAYGQIDSYCGSLTSGADSGNATASIHIKANSSAVSWTNNGFALTIPASQQYYFKAGYTYEFIVSGGF